MCDVESYVYLPLLEETGYMPKLKYAQGPEIREYAETIAEKWKLRDRALFRTQVDALKWDDTAMEWVTTMTQERTGQGNVHLAVRSQFVISASGLLDNPKLPDLHGMDSFRGCSFHTSRWNYQYTGGSPTDPSLINLKNKKVGIIGTAATAVQVVPHLAEWADELYVFQRTPSSVSKRDNRPTDAEWWAREMRNRKGWQRERMNNFAAHVSNFQPLPAVDLVADAWSAMPSFSALIGGPAKVSMDAIPAHVAALHALDFPRQERIRGRVDEVVKDKAVAEKLKPWYHGFCKRPCFHDDYLPAFNQPNVTLVDTNGKGVDSITADGVVVDGTEYKLDCLIFSTGFRSPGVGNPGSRAGVSITGRGGQSMDQKWAEGVSTLHGVISTGFPNLFFPGPMQAGASVNQMFVLDELSKHVAYILAEAARGQRSGRKITIEPTAAAAEAWAMQILSRAATFAALSGCTPSYINREGEMDRTPAEDRMKAARGAIWGEGMLGFVDVIEEWRRDGGLKGLEVTACS